MIVATTGMAEMPRSCESCAFCDWEQSNLTGRKQYFCRETQDFLDALDLELIQPGSDSACPLMEIDTNGGDKNA